VEARQRVCSSRQKCACTGLDKDRHASGQHPALRRCRRRPSAAAPASAARRAQPQRPRTLAPSQNLPACCQRLPRPPVQAHARCSPARRPRSASDSRRGWGRCCRCRCCHCRCCRCWRGRECCRLAGPVNLCQGAPRTRLSRTVRSMRPARQSIPGRRRGAPGGEQRGDVARPHGRDAQPLHAKDCPPPRRERARRRRPRCQAQPWPRALAGVPAPAGGQAGGRAPRPRCWSWTGWPWRPRRPLPRPPPPRPSPRAPCAARTRRARLQSARRPPRPAPRRPARGPAARAAGRPGGTG